ncbi:MAG: RidA family protein, partial [Campylobacteraceae bacterium]
ATHSVKNIERVLISRNSPKDKVVKCTVYISNISYWDEVNAIYSEFFADHKPARSIVPTRELHNGCLIEIEAIAEIKG